MNEWKTVNGYGAPAIGILADCVAMSIRGGNLAGKIEARVSPRAWENCVIQLGEHRPVDFEQFENKAVLISFVLGRKIRVIADETIEGPDEVRFRAIP